jgi:hypothetical protein
MKILSGLLVAVLILHLQCGGSCLLNSSSRGAAALAAISVPEPPCHQHAELPSRNQTPKHDSNNPCDHGPLAQSTLSAAAKAGVNAVGVLPPGIETVVTHDSANSVYIPEEPPHVRSVSARMSILRI